MATMVVLIVTVVLMAYPSKSQMTHSKFSSFSSLLLASASSPRRHDTPSSPLEKKRPSTERGCFVGSAGRTRTLTTHCSDSIANGGSTANAADPALPPSLLPEHRPSHATATPMHSNDRREGDFDLQKARLMARFSSVAYEDPPKTDDALVGSGAEQFIDEYGVSITRPISQCNFQHSPACNEEEGAGSNTWDMAHTGAMSPRSLMLMLSGCNASGMPEKDSRRALEQAQFQWVTLATSQTTSAQFDAWRISTADNATIAGDDKRGSDSILVIAFRGTRILSFLDLLTDIQLKQDLIRCSDFGVCMAGAKDLLDDSPKRSNGNDEDKDTKLKVHSGFLRAYTSIRASLLQLLSDNAGTYDEICFTGHSLGAAISTLALVDVGSIMSNSAPSITLEPASAASPTPKKRTLHLPKVTLSSYLFGTPRVGNRAFADRLSQLQNQREPVIREYYRVNTPGDAVVFLPRGKVVNRLDIDYAHAGASVFLPACEKSNCDSGRMTRREEGTIEKINERIFGRDGDSVATNTRQANSKPSTVPRADDIEDDRLSKIRIYPKGDQPPDPLSEVDPGYAGFLPTDPRTWLSSDFQNFVLGEAVRSFRILRGGFVKNHQLRTYEDGLCRASHDVLVVDPVE